jgi:hypothetical protein
MKMESVAAMPGEVLVLDESAASWPKAKVKETKKTNTNVAGVLNECDISVLQAGLNSLTLP